VVRNHAGGTGLRGWNPRGRSDDWPSSREWTHHEYVDGGATGASSSTRARTCGRNPREKADLHWPGRSVRLRRGAKVRRFARTVPSGNGRRTGSGTLEDEPGNRQTSRRAWERPTTHSAPRTGQDLEHRKMIQAPRPRAPREPHGSSGAGTRREPPVPLKKRLTQEMTEKTNTAIY
jgi:hypothetical protein